MTWIIFGVLIIIFLIFVSAFFSSSEMAFVSLNKAVVVDKARRGDKKAKILEELMKNPDNVISAIVIGNNLVNILASILGEVKSLPKEGIDYQRKMYKERMGENL